MSATSPRPRATDAFDAIISALIAPACASCRAPLDAPTEGPVCRGCWDAIRPVSPPLCRSCGEALATWRPSSLGGGRCPRCRRRGSALAWARSVGTYEGALAAIVQAFKYERRRRIAGPLGRLMAEAGGELLDGADLVTPVPLHWMRRWTRGFNQAEDLARQLGRPVVHALRRTRPTRSQADLPAARRHANVRGAFAVTKGVDVSGAVVVLVDDVATTGATLDACARVLVAAGAREVRALTAARAASRPR